MGTSADFEDAVRNIFYNMTLDCWRSEWSKSGHYSFWRERLFKEKDRRALSIKLMTLI